MKHTKLAFIFPENTVEEPITYNLITDYGVRVNILRASIDPGKQGRMVVELSAGSLVKLSSFLVRSQEVIPISNSLTIPIKSIQLSQSNLHKKFWILLRPKICICIFKQSTIISRWASRCSLARQMP